MMRVKAVQIAKELGISKATVSLALNHKPGVSEKTKKKVFACKEKLEKNGATQLFSITLPSEKNIVKIVVASKGLRQVFAPEMDLWTEVHTVFVSEAKKSGYSVETIYVDIRQAKLDRLIEECNGSTVAGVILQATELDDKDISVFEKIKNPMVIYDNESTDSCHNCVVADNYLGVNRAVSYLFRKGYKDIIYMANTKEIYNFRKRREGFCKTLTEYNLNPYQPSRVVPVGSTIENICNKTKQYLDTRGLPDAFVLENYQVTIGVTMAMRERRIKVPEQVALIGIDEIPRYMTGDFRLTSVRVPHMERATLTMMLLRKEIEEQSSTKSRIMTDCRLIEGESV